MKNKAFTLIELLAVITLLGIIALIIVPSVDSVIKKGKNKVYETAKQSIITSAKLWITDNSELLQDEEKLVLSLGDLKEQGYIDFEFRNPKTEMCVSNNMELQIQKNGKKYNTQIIGDELIDGGDSDCDNFESSIALYLNGDAIYTMNAGDTYVEPGIIAKNTKNEDLQSYVTYPDDFDNRNVGDKVLTYTLKYHGFTKKINRTIRIIDTIKPIITVANDMNLPIGVNFDILEGVKVSDNSSNKIELKTTSNLLTNVAGTYTVTYTAIDSSGNTASVNRKITVIKMDVILKSYNVNNKLSNEDFHRSSYSLKIHSIKFVNYVDTTDAIVTWDLSEKQDKTIIGWLINNKDNSSYYDMYVGTYNNLYAPVDFGYWLSGLEGLYTIDFGNLNTSKTNNMSHLFEDDYYLTSLDLSSFNTSNVTDMSWMFEDAAYKTGANFVLNLGTNFDTSKVTDMNNMFNRTGFISMTSLSFGDKFDTSSVTDMSYMFSSTGYFLLTKLDLGSAFNTSNVTDMSYMFYKTGYIEMTSLSLGDKFDTSSVTNMSYMFSYTGYTSMTSLNLGSLFDTSNVTNMKYMFCNTGYTSMTSLNLGSMFSTSSVTNMSYMFCNTGYTSMTSLSLGSKFNTSKATDMNNMFNRTGYKKLTSLSLGNLFDTSNVTNMYRMFYYTGYTSLTTLDLGPAFKKISYNNIDIFYYAGKSSGCTIKVSSAIYNNSNTTLKLSATSSSKVSWTGRTGTITNAYTS